MFAAVVQSIEELARVDRPYSNEQMENMLECALEERGMRREIVYVTVAEIDYSYRKSAAGLERDNMKKDMLLALQYLMKSEGSRYTTYVLSEASFDRGELYVELADSGGFLVKYSAVVSGAGTGAGMKIKYNHCCPGSGGRGGDHYSFDLDSGKWVAK